MFPQLQILLINYWETLMLVDLILVIIELI